MKPPRSKTKKYINKDMPAAEKLYNAKILLFGEYGIIKDSMGLSIPYDFYKGALVFSENMTPEMQKSNESIGDFCAWLKDLNGKEFFKSHIDTDRLENDIENGLYFDSSIPLGYGVGSSGALVAAVYERYADNRHTRRGIPAGHHSPLRKPWGTWRVFSTGTAPDSIL